VKRTDQEDSSYLIGIEFVGRDYLSDKLSHGELEVLSENLSDFNQTVQDVLRKYIYRKQVVPHGK